MKSLIIFITLLSIVCGDHQFKVTNNCEITLWAGTVSGSDPNNPPESGSFQLDSRQSRSFNIPDHWSGNIYPKRTENSPPSSATLAEFTLNANGKDFYDVSLVNGFNFPLAIFISSYKKENDSKYDCGNPTCRVDLNNNCPNELRHVENGQTVACYSACSKFHEDQYCCINGYDQPNTCDPNTWSINSAAYFKQNCPDAYSYAYDDQFSTFTCHGNPITNYEIVFCP